MDLPFCFPLLCISWGAMHFRIFSSILNFYHLCQEHAHCPNGDNQKCIQTLLNVPWGVILPMVENHHFRSSTQVYIDICNLNLSRKKSPHISAPVSFHGSWFSVETEQESRLDFMSSHHLGKKGSMGLYIPQNVAAVPDPREWGPGRKTRWSKPGIERHRERCLDCRSSQ